MSEQKTNPQTLGASIGDYLKWEATHLTRVAVTAGAGTKAGTFVDYPARSGKKLLALTDEQDGKVLVQPHNCIIDLSLVPEAAASSGESLAGLQADGDSYGIVYIGTPVAAG